jgi:hypothetical protein
LGKEKVNLIQNFDDTIDNGIINLLPLCFLDKYTLKGDLFLSTWAISESSENSQEYVIKNKWFDAKHLLLAYNKNSSRFPHDKTHKLAKKSGLIIEKIEFLPDHRYAFR